MSVFSMIKRGRQAAKEHKAEKAQREKEEAQKPPYKHVPRHAAIDALSGGPAGWREADRQKIVDQNRRRSALTASGVGMSGMMTPVHSGIPRVHSSLSHVSYPSAYASPVVHLPRNYSYSGMGNAGWSHQGGEMSYTPIDMVGGLGKGKEVERIRIDSGNGSRSSSRVSTGRLPLPGPSASGDSAVSPVDSSSNSTSSQDDLEMKPVGRAATSPPSTSVTSRAYRALSAASDTDSVHRLHPAGHARRTSDPNNGTMPAAQPRNPPLASRSSPLAPGIPPVPALPPMQFGTAITTSNLANLGSSTPNVSSSASSSSSVTMVPAMSSASLAGKASAPPQLAIPVSAPIAIPMVQTGDLDFKLFDEPVQPVSVAVPVAQSSPQRGRRTSKMTRFTELETIDSNISAQQVESVSPLTPSPREKKFPTSTVTALPTEFDKTSLPPTQEIVLPPPQKGGKLVKNATGAKLAKKNRWSLRNRGSAVAV